MSWLIVPNRGALTLKLVPDQISALVLVAAPPVPVTAPPLVLVAALPLVLLAAMDC